METININGGLFGNFSLSFFWDPERKDYQYKPILKNGQFFLPWHITAALHNAGWLEKDKSEIILVLLNAKKHYNQFWKNAVSYINSLTGEYVY